MNELQIKFTKVYSGCLDFSVIYGETKLDYTFSCIWGNPDELVKWAEKVYYYDPGEFYSDAEGWYWYFDYKDGEFIVSDDLKFNEAKNEREKIERLRVKIPRRDLAIMICKAIVDFRDSPLYDAREWDGVNMEDLFESCYGSAEKALTVLPTLTYSEFVSTLKKRCLGTRYTPEKFDFDDLLFAEEDEQAEYDAMDENARKDKILEWIGYHDTMGFGGYPLHKIKSDLLDYVALPDPLENDKKPTIRVQAVVSDYHTGLWLLSKPFQAKLEYHALPYSRLDLPQNFADELWKWDQEYSATWEEDGMSLEEHWSQGLRLARRLKTLLGKKARVEFGNEYLYVCEVRLYRLSYRNTNFLLSDDEGDWTYLENIFLQNFSFERKANLVIELNRKLHNWADSYDKTFSREQIRKFDERGAELAKEIEEALPEYCAVVYDRILD